DSFDNGWYRTNGVAFHLASNTNTVTGGSSGAETRSFYAFDLSALTSPATSARMTFFAGNGTYGSNDPSETVRLVDVTTPTDVLTADAFGPAAVPIFDDLGAGDIYGEATASGALGDPMPEIGIDLSAAAIADINAAAGGTFAIAAVLLSVDGAGGAQVLWDGSDGVPAARLTLETTSVPVPAAAPLLLSALAGWAAVARRRRARAA
ncbi:MAG: hypothetical protein AAFU61_02395, partial [Pseudomonadota bacterium]